MMTMLCTCLVHLLQHLYESMLISQLLPELFLLNGIGLTLIRRQVYGVWCMVYGVWCEGTSTIKLIPCMFLYRRPLRPVQFFRL